jgi:hypothetical protein
MSREDAMSQKTLSICIALCLLLAVAGSGLAGDQEIAGVTFPGEKAVAGKTLRLNGVALRKAMGFIKVFAGGFYLETPTTDAREAIDSRQVKHFHLHYLTGKATAKKLSEGFVKAITKANPPELVAKHRDLIERYAGWYDRDMQPGDVSLVTYVPGGGLTLELAGTVKGTIADEEFCRMYLTYQLGEKANKALRTGYLGGR